MSYVRWSSIPNYKILFKDLGYTTPSEQKKIRAECKEFRDKYPAARSFKCEGLTNSYLAEHQKEIGGIVEAFLNKHAEQLWPSDEHASQHHRLQYPKDEAESFQDNNTNTFHEQENTVVAKCSARSLFDQSYDNDDSADGPSVSASEARFRTNSTRSAESSIADEAEPVPGFRASKSTAGEQPPVGEDSTRAVSTDEVLADTGPTEGTAGQLNESRLQRQREAMIRS
ncbi:hypothetical protein BDP55DRAFT_732994 [Colletotrichum godetiae]|uniref:Uncharacterized protein n=1 Tax=Colletotrichum godetiae TaxID=1209918 RepID=A0AAJ0ESR8_9PEZI|nr:uncharacterized protein BDP55DRAFT_732994 [Colletotrichum godetiae]KAK1659824.1 hypothetical protein BDP55DRAFT_732994 [Colletotrichum godetiae]